MSTSSPPVRKKLSTRVFSREGLCCPHCKNALGEALASCPNCGFRLESCAQLLGNQAPPLDFIIDPGGFLPPEAASELEQDYKRLQRKFPQVSLSLSFVEVSPPFKVNELAFWLINTSPNPDEARPWKIVLVFDYKKFEAGVAFGYAIEPFLTSDSWKELLEEVTRKAYQEDWLLATKHLMKKAIPLLTESKRNALSRSKKSAQHSASS